jgi:hypothetical protein
MNPINWIPIGLLVVLLGVVVWDICRDLLGYPPPPQTYDGGD